MENTRLPRLDFDPADHPDEWELVGIRDGVPVYSPIDIGGCGGCDNGECCSETGGECCGQGENGACPSRAACVYEFDGTDTDGTEWFRCVTHDELAPGHEAPCAGYIEESYNP